MPDRDQTAPNIPEHLRFAPEHAWAAPGEDAVVTVGITDYAQGQLGEIVWVTLPSVGQEVVLGASFAEAESDKTISDVCAPCSGEVVEVNAQLERTPALVNDEPYGGGWIARVRASDLSELDKLMDAAGYRAMLERG